MHPGPAAYHKIMQPPINEDQKICGLVHGVAYHSIFDSSDSSNSLCKNRFNHAHFVPSLIIPIIP